ncbi:MAG: ribonuclease III [Thermaurantimonas sp.]
MTLKNWISQFSSFIPSTDDKRLRKALKKILGFRPKTIHHYRKALRHRSFIKLGNCQEDYERLEFLGDAVLGAVVAGYLFEKFPHQKEGFLSEVRSKIVNRNNLHSISRKLDIPKLISEKSDSASLPKSFYGDVLEALIGAVYLDRGYAGARSFILKKIIRPNVQLDEIVHRINSHKAYLHEWAQKNRKNLQFKIIDSWGSRHNLTFEMGCYIDGQLISSGTGYTKKSAEEEASKLAIEILKLA